MTDQKARFVIGLDPLIATTSMSLIAEGADIPITKLLVSHPTEDHSVAGFHARMATTAAEIVTSVTKNGKPALVVMMKPLTGATHKDPTGPKRAMLVGEIQRRLLAEKIPVAEAPPLTVSKFVLGGFQAGGGSVSDVEKKVREVFRGIEEPEGKRSAYRWTTVGLAAAAAMAVGISTPMIVSNAALKTLAQGLVLPQGMAIPATADEWKAEHLALAETAA